MYQITWDTIQKKDLYEFSSMPYSQPLANVILPVTLGIVWWDLSQFHPTLPSIWCGFWLPAFFFQVCLSHPGTLHVLENKFLVNFIWFHFTARLHSRLEQRYLLGYTLICFACLTTFITLSFTCSKKSFVSDVHLVNLLVNWCAKNHIQHTFHFSINIGVER